MGSPLRPTAEPIAEPAAAVREKTVVAAELTKDAAVAEPAARASSVEWVEDEKVAG